MRACTLLSILAILARAVAGFLMLAFSFEPKHHALRNAILVAFAYSALSACAVHLLAPYGTGVRYIIEQMLYFSLILAGASIGIHAIWRSSWLAAIFCATAGYTVQNLASGADELLWMLCAGPRLANPFTPEYMPLFCLSTAATYIPYWLLFVRPTTKAGLGHVQDRSLVAAMMLAIASVIGFDLVIKSLTQEGRGLAILVLLRLLHILACVYVLWLLYILLVRNELERELAQQSLQAEERESQYLLVRSSIEDVNAQMHDIRHAVMRRLEDAAPEMDRDAAADIARKISVFDASVHTGNEALDTVLTKQGLALRQKGVTLSCMAEGKVLEKMDDGDIYALFDTLIQAAADAGCDAISVLVHEALGAAAIHVGWDEGSRSLDNASLAEARSIVRRAGGTLRQEGVSIDILLPPC